MSFNNIVDTAVDKAAAVAKVKVKNMLAGDGGKKQGKSGGAGGSGGIGGLFPSASGGDNSSKGEKGKSKGAGLFDGLMGQPKAEEKPKPAADAGNADFNSAIDELADI